MNIYIDAYIYRRAVTGLETASLIGNIGKTTIATLAGAMTWPVGPATTVTLSMFDQITIFDGDTSEVAQAATSVAVGASTIPLLQPLQYAHGQYTTFCTDGVLGSLADSIVEASNWVENLCQQSLFQQSYSGETLKLPSMRASINNRQKLVFRPRHFPVLTETGLIIESSNSNPVSYDASQIVLDGAKQVVTVPMLISAGGGSGSGQSLYAVTPSRQDELFLNITYTAGYTPDQMPGDVRDSAVMLTSEIIARRQNPTGANILGLGDKRIQVTSSRDTVGESLLIKAVKQKLQPYSVEAY